MSTHRRSVRREVSSAEKGLKVFSLETGPVVLYYEFDVARTTTSDVYGEGFVPDPFDPDLTEQPGGLAYKPAKLIRSVWWRFNPSQSVQTETGEYTVDTSSLRFTAETMRRSGLENPLDPEAHFNDRYYYQGKLYRVEQYTPKGQLFGTAYLMVDVNGRQLKPEELDTDLMPFAEVEGTETGWTPGQVLDWPEVPVSAQNQQPPPV